MFDNGKENDKFAQENEPKEKRIKDPSRFWPALG